MEKLENLFETAQKVSSQEYAEKILESDQFASLSESAKDDMRILFQNTQKEISTQLTEGTYTTDVAQFTPILLPMIRRVQPTLIANEILGVQPLSTPTGFLYALVNQYLGNGIAKVGDGTEPQGIIVELDDIANFGATITVDGSTQFGDGKALYVEGNKVLATFNTRPLVGQYIDANLGLNNTQGAKVVNVWTNESAFYQVLKNYTGAYSTYEGEQLGDDMNEVGFSVLRKPVVAKTRALKGKYTMEMYQDLRSQHGLIADDEMMNLMSYEIKADIDRECIDFVKGNSTWLPDTTTKFVVGSQTNMQVPEGRWEIERYRAQAIRIAKESAMIGLETKRGQGNILIVSPMVCTMLEQVGNFSLAPIQSTVKQPISGGVAGIFDNKYKVVVDQYATNDYCTVLYKGDSNKDAMGFYCPYVPLSFTRITDYVTGQPVIIAKTRYALTTTPGVESAESKDRAKTYARSFGIDFANTILGR